MIARRWLWGAGAACALIVAGASLPMRLLLDSAGAGGAGLSAREVKGTIWNAQLVDARLGALPLGMMKVSLSPLALLSGQTALNFSRQDAALGDLNGRLHGSGARGFSAVNGSVALGARLGGISVGRLNLADAALRFDDEGRCREAGGTVTVVLAAPIAGLQLAQGLSGPLTCADGRAQVHLASQSGMEKLRLSFGADGAWQAQFRIAASSDPALSSGLAAAGFRAVADGYAMSLSGQI